MVYASSCAEKEKGVEEVEDGKAGLVDGKDHCPTLFCQPGGGGGCGGGLCLWKRGEVMGVSKKVMGGGGGVKGG